MYRNQCETALMRNIMSNVMHNIVCNTSKTAHPLYIPIPPAIQSRPIDTQTLFAYNHPIKKSLRFVRITKNFSTSFEKFS